METTLRVSLLITQLLKISLTPVSYTHLIVIYKSDDRLKLEKEVIRAKKSGFPYAIIVPRDTNTTV